MIINNQTKTNGKLKPSQLGVERRHDVSREEKVEVVGYRRMFIILGAATAEKIWDIKKQASVRNMGEKKRLPEGRKTK